MRILILQEQGEVEWKFEFWEPGKIQDRLLRVVLPNLTGLRAIENLGEMNIDSKERS